MSDNIMKDAFLASLPPGSLWEVKYEDGFDNLLSGMADNSEALRLFLSDLAFIRSPQKTPILSDLEKEFRYEPVSGQTEAEQRIQLASIKAGLKSDGTDITLQNQLQAAGFDVIVVRNDPPANPDLFLGTSYQTYLAGHNAYCGNSGAFCSNIDTRYVINADSYKLGHKEYETPAISDYWKMIFFVVDSVLYETVYNAHCGGQNAYCGGEEAFCSDDNTITTQKIKELIPFSTPLERRAELEKIILAYKPLGTWGMVSAIFT